MEFKLLEGVAIIAPWCNHGVLKVVSAEDGSERVHHKVEVSDKATLDKALVKARQLANQLAGSDGYGVIETPPCHRCRSLRQVARVEGEMSHGVPISPHLHRS
jgi:hypothetical protein